MKLSEHVDKLRSQIEGAFDKYLALMGIGRDRLTEVKRPELQASRQRFEPLLASHTGETGCYAAARDKLIDELTFTLFNRFAAIKVMEAANMFPPVLTRQAEHGGRSFGHKVWLEERPHLRSEELEGLGEYISSVFEELGRTLPLYHSDYSYGQLPDLVSLNEIIDAFNQVEKDAQVGAEVWKSDDILGWLYESYNSAKKQLFKESKEKTEYHKVSLQSQVYTPRWVVQFLVDNSLGKLYLEMFPDSEIKKTHKIANAPEKSERPRKPLHEIRLIDPACGSGNFLLYAFDLFYELYLDQIENYGADYDEAEIPRLIIENNLHGIDLDDRAVQLAQLGLYIKARKKRRTVGNLKFKVVSSDFYLPDYEEVRSLFEAGAMLDSNQKQMIADIWGDLKFAYKFGSLIQLEARFKSRLNALLAKRQKPSASLFSDEELGIEKKPVQPELYTEMAIADEHRFAAEFFAKLKAAVEQHARSEGDSFITSKTRDAITFLELLTSEYDVATANPPYTDSSDFGPELKVFIEANYKKPWGFHTNLYATFIKRCYDFADSAGKVALVHPPTFMYIKTFEDVRKFIVEQCHISLFVEWGYLGMFNPSARVDSAVYVLEKSTQIKKTKNSVFIKLNHLYETKRYKALFEAFEKYIKGEVHPLLYSIPQEKLKIIKLWPFIYWISDDFRERFAGWIVANYYKDISVGLQIPSGNERVLRFHWEVEKHSKFRPYSKGGDFNNWYGNEWLVIPEQILKDISLAAKKKQEKFGVTSSRTTGKGTSFRIKDRNTLVDNNTINIFVESKDEAYYLLGLLNSKVNRYIFDCLNPTVHVQAGDLQRVPMPRSFDKQKSCIQSLAKKCVDIKIKLSTMSFIEPNFSNSPLTEFRSMNLTERIKCFLNFENYLMTQLFIIEAANNNEIFQLYDLTESDKAMVLAKEGGCIGDLPVSKEAKIAFLAENYEMKNLYFEDVIDFIMALPNKNFSIEERIAIENGFPTLYQANCSFEEFCIKNRVNPINIWYWFKEGNVIPKQRMNTLAFEFLADIIRSILLEDNDGIVPLVANSSEKTLLELIEEKFIEKGFTMAQYSSFDSILGRPLNVYLNQDFFEKLSERLNLFQHLPMTPFIWHLSSGPEQGFDCYIIIYKWSRDKLMRLRSVYIEHRERALKNRQSDIADKNTAEAQNEKDLIFKQLKEIETFKKKIDELLAEGYNPILDDGVGKNIAPLQKKKMIPYEVLNPGQLKKYLNADW